MASNPLILGSEFRLPLRYFGVYSKFTEHLLFEIRSNGSKSLPQFELILRFLILKVRQPANL